LCAAADGRRRIHFSPYNFVICSSLSLPSGSPTPYARSSSNQWQGAVLFLPLVALQFPNPIREISKQLVAGAVAMLCPKCKIFILPHTQFPHERLLKFLVQA
jgi:hypothetical protein